MTTEFLVVLHPSEVSGVVEMQVLKQQGPIKLSTLQEAVGGFIECVYSGPLTLFCNEEGKLRGLPYNEVATDLWQTLLREEVGFEFTPDALVGSVVITGDVDKDGEQWGLGLAGISKFAELVLGNSGEFVSQIAELAQDA